MKSKKVQNWELIIAICILVILFICARKYPDLFIKGFQLNKKITKLEKRIEQLEQAKK